MARERGLGEVVVGRLEELPFADDSFDLITCLDVIEHTPDDGLRWLSCCASAGPGGFLLVTVPAYPALWSRTTRPTTTTAATPAARCAKPRSAAGWSVCRMSSFNSLLLAPAAAVRLAQRRRGATNGYTNDLDLGRRGSTAALEQPLRAEASWLARGRTLPAGLSLIACCASRGRRDGAARPAGSDRPRRP